MYDPQNPQGQLPSYLQPQPVASPIGGITEMVKALMAGKEQHDQISNAAAPAMTQTPGQPMNLLPPGQPTTSAHNYQSMPALSTPPPQNPYGTYGSTGAVW